MQPSQLHDTWYYLWCGGGICEYCADKDVRSPVGMSDTLAAAQINNVEAKVTESVVRFKQGGIGIGTVELEIGKE